MRREQKGLALWSPGFLLPRFTFRGLAHVFASHVHLALIYTSPFLSPLSSPFDSVREVLYMV